VLILLDEPPLLAVRGADALADPLRVRWERASKLGLRRESDAYPEGIAHAELAVRRDCLAHTFREEAALLGPITGQLSAKGLVSIVADPEGVILGTQGGEAFADNAARVRLVDGARWSEGARGTNAIGTAIVEARAVGVVGAAHYEQRNHGIFCYATPIRDAYGDIAAVLDVTGPLAAHDRAVGAAVCAAGAALERALRALAFARVGASLLRTIERLVRSAASPAFLVDAMGNLRVINAAAEAELFLAPDASVSCERVFGVGVNELLRLAQGGPAPRFETKQAVYDVMLDPILGEGDRLLALTVMLERRQAGRRNVAAGLQLEPVSKPRAPSPFDAIASQDAAVNRAKEDAARFAVTSLAVLLLAETGTGKELFARAIHGASAQAQGPFVAVNCGSLTASLLESELFGYAPGAFTGASRSGAEGRLAAADGGTLFLDEIAEMPEPLQAAMLRVLDDGTYTRVGDTKPRKAQFRLICATCRDLPALVAQGKFRQDLFYRIFGACVTIPPLRQRSDRVWLAQQLLRAAAAGAPASLGLDAQEWIEQHDWPGNVRELKSAVAHAVAMASGQGALGKASFPRPILPSVHREPEGTRTSILRDAFAQALEASRGNVSEAARRLGVARSTLYRAARPKQTK
jgi:transcriptional regulator of acetoin/glycerol metabolism